MAEKILYSGKRYRSFDHEMKQRFGGKVVKLSVDGGFSCPNRVNSTGCIFCTERGSGEFSGDHENQSMSITEQIEFQKSMMSKKWDSDRFIAYFQNYTNTYDSVDRLKARYDEALSCGVMGFAVATRPDCLGDDVLDLLSSYDCPLWVEFGLQSIHCASQINRGYDNSVYVDSANRLKQRGIEFVTHVIIGLPWETPQQALETVKFAVDNGTNGIKLHMLYIDKTAPLADYYQEHGFHVLTRDEYVDTVCEAISILPQNVVVHRLTGDGKRENLIEPQWTRDKRAVLNSIDKRLAEKNYFQGCNILEGLNE